ANPRLHRDSLLVFAGEDIASWNLYEAGHAYFPVQFIHSPEGLEPSRLEKYSLMLSQADFKNRKDLLDIILRSSIQHADAIIVPGELDRDFAVIIDETLTNSKLENHELKMIYK
ncbi:MAG: hypothetical protein ACKO85_00125, partial [Isosphaeraceae bacterium]